MRPPMSLMAQVAPSVVDSVVSASAIVPTYATDSDPESAKEILAARMARATEAAKEPMEGVEDPESPGERKMRPTRAPGARRGLGRRGAGGSAHRAVGDVQHDPAQRPRGPHQGSLVDSEPAGRGLTGGLTLSSWPARPLGTAGRCRPVEWRWWCARVHRQAGEPARDAGRPGRGAGGAGNQHQRAVGHVVGWRRRARGDHQRRRRGPLRARGAGLRLPRLRDRLGRAGGQAGSPRRSGHDGWPIAA